MGYDESRAKPICGATPALDKPEVAQEIESWVDCGGKLRVDHALTLGHGLGMPYEGDPTLITDLALDFIDSTAGAP